MKTSTRKDVEKLAANIEELAKLIQQDIKDNQDYLARVTALVNRSTTMVFVVGEVSAEEQRKAARKAAYANRQYVRDSSGRFTSR